MQTRAPQFTRTVRGTLLTLVGGLTLSASVALGQSYTFTTIDMPFPDACCTQITGTNRHQIKVGTFSHPSHEFMGFRGMAGKYTMFPLLSIADINDAGVMVGSFMTPQDDSAGQAQRIITGFVHTGSSFAIVHVPGMYHCFPAKIGSQGTIVGSCQVTRDSQATQAFLHFPDGTYQVLEVPFESLDGFRLTGINEDGGLGQLIGSSSGRGFVRLSTGDFKRVDVPNAGSTLPLAIRGGTIIGRACAGEDCWGFLVRIATGVQGAGEQCCDWHETYREIRVPSSTFTSVDDLNTAGDLVGSWVDASGMTHGFVATPR